MRIITLIENTPGAPGCVHEHGLSLYVETARHTLLMDTGATGAFADNAAALGLDLSRVDTVVLSHGHYDHAGGLLRLVELAPHAQIYMQRGAGRDFYHGDRYIGIDKAILDLPNLHLLDGDCRLDEELFLFAGITGRGSGPAATWNCAPPPRTASRCRMISPTNNAWSLPRRANTFCSPAVPITAYSTFWTATGSCSAPTRMWLSAAST